MRHVVILAGGGGTRFWPLSTPERPKQFLNLFGRKTLLAQTVDRCRGLVPPSRTWIVTAERHLALTHREAPRIPRRNLMGEPVGRNSAAAIALAAEVIGALDPEAVLLFLPADPHIPDPAAFRRSARMALEVAEGAASAARSSGIGARRGSDALGVRRGGGAIAAHVLVTLGIRPTFPSTGYGYLLPVRRSRGDTAIPLRRFVEKPREAKARRLITSGAYWNAGMFAGRASTFHAAFAQFMPALVRGLRGVGDDWRRGAGSFARALRRRYPRLPSISIDYGVMERACGSRGWSVEMVPGRFAWSDVGTWKAVYDLLPKDKEGNVIQGKCWGQARDSLILGSGNREILVGNLVGLAVVESPDGTLICSLGASERVREIGEIIARRTNRPRDVDKPILIDSSGAEARRLSRQLHRMAMVAVPGLQVKHGSGWTHVGAISRVTVVQHALDSYCARRDKHRGVRT